MIVRAALLVGVLVVGGGVYAMRAHEEAPKPAAPATVPTTYMTSSSAPMGYPPDAELAQIGVYASSGLASVKEDGKPVHHQGSTPIAVTPGRHTWQLEGFLGERGVLVFDAKPGARAVIPAELR